MPLVDIGIAAGRIVALEPSLAEATARQQWDLAGRVVLPGLVDLHTHLDKTYLDAPNRSGTLLEAIDVWRAVKQNRSPAETKAAVRRALQTAISHGITAMRSHVDTEVPADLTTLEAILEVRQEMAASIDLQLVALGFPGNEPENETVIREALRLGADFIGGAPALTPDPRRTLEATFELAAQTGKPIDLHIDETEDPEVLTLTTLADLTLAHGMQEQVTAGHCCSLGFVDVDTAAPVIDKVARAAINIVTLPSCNLVLMGRGMQPVPRGITLVKELLAAGVNVCAASDNVQDPFNPFGGYDLLQIANLTAHLAHLTSEVELRTSLALVSEYPSRAFGRQAPGISLGAVADLVVLETTHHRSAVTNPPPRLATFKGGKLITRASVARTWYTDYA